MIVQPLQQSFAGEGFALAVLKYPARRLAMPDQAMPEDKNLVLCAEGDVMVHGIEVVAIRARINEPPLQNVLRADGIELRRDNGVGARIALLELRRIQCCADTEYPLIGVLERGRALAVRARAGQNE